MPAESALKKHRDREAQITSDVQELQQKIAAVRAALAEARADTGMVAPKPTEELEAEREDLEITRAAIQEAKEEVAKLKQRLEEQKQLLTPVAPMMSRPGVPTI